LNVTTYPSVAAHFDDKSASLEIKGTYIGAVDTDSKDNRSYMVGPITITFIGQLDSDRSDQLLSSSNDTPVWNATLGYSKTTLLHNDARRHEFSAWLFILWVPGIVIWFL
jgi:hypothetical protein